MRLRLAIVLTGLTVVGCTSSDPSPRTREGASRITISPHTDALRLVFDNCADRIRQLEGESAWFDADERIWVVTRPFEPGVVDSTHDFYVEYRINGKPAAAWNVDTRQGTASETEVPRH